MMLLQLWQLNSLVATFNKMGLYLSKPDPPSAWSKRRSPTCDDDRSKVTARTEDSSVLMVRDSQTRVGRETIASSPIERYQKWSSSSRSAPSHTRQNPRRSRSSDSSSMMDTHHAVIPLSRRDSDPGRPKTASLPVKCPPRKRRPMDPSVDPALLEHAGDEDTEYLVRLYDTRTWEMYHRITEARKNSQPVSYDAEDLPTKKSHFFPRREETTAEWENLQLDHFDNETEHETVFLFDWD